MRESDLRDHEWRLVYTVQVLRRCVRLVIECLAPAKAETLRHLFNASLSPVARLATYH